MATILNDITVRNLRMRVSNEAADTIHQFIEGSGGRWDWDDFLCHKVKGLPDYNEMLNLISSIPDRFPPDEKGHWCSGYGIALLLEIAELIKSPEWHIAQIRSLMGESTDDDGKFLSPTKHFQFNSEDDVVIPFWARLRAGVYWSILCSLVAIIFGAEMETLTAVAGLSFLFGVVNTYVLWLGE